MKSKRSRLLVVPVLAVALLYLILLIPPSEDPVVLPALGEPFAWNWNAYWSSLEQNFRQIRAGDIEDAAVRTDSAMSHLVRQLDSTTWNLISPGDSVFPEIEREFFELAALVASCPARAESYLDLYDRLRAEIKRTSVNWDLSSPQVRDRLYRLLYGGRVAVEEVILQSPPGSVPDLKLSRPVPSATPAAELLGVEVHSGDILVSRGGAATSALIARGNDYPGNFSHVALLHVAEKTGEVSLIEAHIEKGVAVADLSEYLGDMKLRIMILRLRPDLPSMQADPLLPHKAATAALENARTDHIPYDFEMDIEDPSRLFCSEVASQAYKSVGIRLWMGLSHISGKGVASWLAGFGVRNFTTQEPSDLEYDPQLQVVAEWRGYETLRKDRLDNAVVDVMLRGAERGDKLDYDWYMLPIARVIKAYSAILNQFGTIGPIPEGMGPTAALRHSWFTGKHDLAVARLKELVREFEAAEGYFPPYWTLVDLARKAYTD